MAQITLNSTGVASSGALVLQTNGTTTAVTVDTSQNVGIGTSSPSQKLQVNGTGRFYKASVSTVGAVASSGLLIDGAGATGNLSQIGFGYDASLTNMPASIYGITTNQSGNTAMAIGFATRSATTDTAPTEAARIDSSGNLLVGVASANANGGVLQLKSGITFPATAVAATDANTLDDYEEGTWTMGVSFGGGTTGITYNASYVTGSYTKIGNRVFISGVLVLTNKGSASGDALLTGLPFTSSSSGSGASAFSQALYNATFTGQQFLETSGGTTTAYLWQVSELGVRSALTNTNFANDSQITVGGSYVI